MNIVQLWLCRLAAIVLLLLGMSSLASAQNWMPKGQFGWLGVGTAHQIEKGHLYWLGEFSGIFFNDAGPGNLMHNSGIKCPAYNDIDLNNKKSIAAGYCIVLDRDGDQAFGPWKCEGDGQSCKGTFTWIGGTGKYAKISGTGTFTGVTEVNHVDGKASGYSIWNR